MKILLFKLGMWMLAGFKYAGFTILWAAAVIAAVSVGTVLGHQITRLVLFIWAKS